MWSKYNQQNVKHCSDIMQCRPECTIRLNRDYTDCTLFSSFWLTQLAAVGLRLQCCPLWTAACHLLRLIYHPQYPASEIPHYVSNGNANHDWILTATHLLGLLCLTVTILKSLTEALNPHYFSTLSEQLVFRLLTVIGSYSMSYTLLNNNKFLNQRKLCVGFRWSEYCRRINIDFICSFGRCTLNKPNCAQWSEKTGHLVLFYKRSKKISSKSCVLFNGFLWYIGWLLYEDFIKMDAQKVKDLLMSVH